MSPRQGAVLGEGGEREDGDGLCVGGREQREGGVRGGGPGALVEVWAEGGEGGYYCCRFLLGGGGGGGGWWWCHVGWLGGWLFVGWFGREGERVVGWLW